MLSESLSTGLSDTDQWSGTIPKGEESSAWQLFPCFASGNDVKIFSVWESDIISAAAWALHNRNRTIKILSNLDLHNYMIKNVFPPHFLSL